MVSIAVEHPGNCTFYLIHDAFLLHTFVNGFAKDSNGRGKHCKCSTTLSIRPAQVGPLCILLAAGKVSGGSYNVL